MKAPRGDFGEVVGRSAPMQELYALAHKANATEAPVLLEGEPGTGKALLAQAIHAASARARGRFVAVACGALSPGLLESELLGHERGSFPGAEKRRRGAFERARRGTLFLDEPGDLAPETQRKLTAALETGAVRRLGAHRMKDVGSRLVTALAHPLEEEVARGRLRPELAYLLGVVRLRVPPLRERGRDVVLLAERFLHELNGRWNTHKRLAATVADRLRAHSWPGNVRELRAAVHGAFALGADTLEAHDFRLSAADTAAPRLQLPLGTPLAEAERRLILATLQDCGGDRKRTAEVLGVPLRSLAKRLKGYEAAG